MSFNNNTFSAWFKPIVLSTAVVSTILITGCASKPQVSTSATRYAAAPNYYTVRSGDTLSAIAARYGMNYRDIAALNEIAPPYVITVGQSLRIKGVAQRNSSQVAIVDSKPAVQRQSLTLPASTTVTTSTKIPTTAPTTSATQASVKTNVVSGLNWVRPSQGQIIGQFNEAAGVKGLQFAGKTGDPIVAAADGQVVYAADGLKEFGLLVIIKHVNGYISTYAHNSKVMVSSGDNVKSGQKIAEMGATGTNRIMSEVQIRLNGKPINPVTVLPIN